MKQFYPLKKWLALTILLLSAFQSHADEPSTLLIHFADGTTTAIQLYTRPQITFVGDRVNIKSTVAEFSYPATDVLRFNFAVNGEIVRINDSKAVQDIYFQEGETIIFDASVPSSAIQLFAEDGKRMPVSIKTANGRPTLTITNFPSGVYMLSVNGRTSKFVKR